MRKFDKLIKKVECFEKLAIFSDRSKFLSAIAEDLDPKLKTILDKINIYLRNMSGVDTSKALDAVNNALLFKKIDVNKIINELRNIVHDLPISLGGTERKNINNMIDELKKVQYATQPQDEVMQMPADKISAYPPINKDQQEALSRIIVIEGLGLPLKIDGKLGPKTREALKKFKKHFNLESLSDTDALANAPMLANTLERYKSP
jgi:hypothetical protein